MGLFKSKEEKIKEYNIKMQKEMERINALGVFPTKTLQLQYSAFPIIYIDDNNKKILVINYPGDEYVLNYNDIIDFELKVDDISTFRYSLKTALIGQIDSKKKINNIQVNLYVNNIDNSFIEIRIFPHVGTAVTWYEGENLANELIGVLNYIKNNKDLNNSELKPSKIIKNTSNNSIKNTIDDSEINNLKKQIEEQKEEIKKQQVISEENEKLNKENQLLKQQIEKNKNKENAKIEIKNISKKLLDICRYVIGTISLLSVISLKGFQILTMLIVVLLIYPFSSNFIYSKISIPKALKIIIPIILLLITFLIDENASKYINKANIKNKTYSTYFVCSKNHKLPSLSGSEIIF